MKRRDTGSRGRAVLGAVLAAGMLAGTVCMQAGAEEPFTGVFQASVSTIQEGEHTSFDYPVLTGIDGFDQSIVDAINQYFYNDAYSTAVEEAQSLAEMEEEVREYNPEAAQYLTSEAKCSSIYIDGEIYSVVLDYYTYTGGAHGYSFPDGTTFNLRTGEELTMGGILGCDEATAQEAVVEAYRKEIIGQVENITEESIRSCFDVMSFWKQAEGMYVNISPYNVASYAAGHQTAVVTPEILEAVKNGAAGNGDAAQANGAAGNGDAAAGNGADAAGASAAATITVAGGIAAPESDFIFPFSSERLLTDADLTKLEGADVEEEHYRSQLAINEILARYGYVFHPENGGASKEAYDQFNGKDWYEQAKAYCPSDSANEMLYTYITATELDNINIICEWQKVHNCYY